jgi:hypothetical protein
VPNVPWAWKSFQTHPMVLLGDIGHVEGCFGPIGSSVNLDARSVYDFVLNVPPACKTFQPHSMVLLGDVG